jgi:hypothetical protein
MPRFPPRGPHGCLFPRFVGTIKALRLPAVHPAAFRFLHLAVPRDHASFAPAIAACGGDGPGVVHSVSPSGTSSVETTGSPKFLGNPNSRLHMFLDPGRPVHPRPLAGCLCVWPPLRERRRRRQQGIFRGSIAWLSGSPPTYHDVGYPPPRKTSFQALVRLSWAGFHPQGSDKKVSTHFIARCPPFPSFLAQSRIFLAIIFLSPIFLSSPLRADSTEPSGARRAEKRSGCNAIANCKMKIGGLPGRWFGR